MVDRTPAPSQLALSGSAGQFASNPSHSSYERGDRRHAQEITQAVSNLREDDANYAIAAVHALSKA